MGNFFHCVCARAHLRAFMMLQSCAIAGANDAKIVCSRDAQCNTEESP